MTASKNGGGPAEIMRVRGLTEGQKKLIEAIDRNIITLCSGSAGSGKTLISVSKACEALLDGKFEKILVSRPAVECGESLGFLPGSIEEKYEPYMAPIRDVLSKYFHGKTLKEHLESKTIEFCPLAYLRGRTFNKTFMILDEAQNTTASQVLMYLTRVGKDSKAVLSGDLKQRDLFSDKGVAFQRAMELFDKQPYIDGLEIVHLTSKDIVRSDIVQKIVERLEGQI